MIHKSVIHAWLTNISSKHGLSSNFSIEPIPGDASLRKYYLLLPDHPEHKNSPEFIIMQTPADDSMHNFINIAEYLANLNLNINIPKIFDIYNYNHNNNNNNISYLLLSYLGEQLLFNILNNNININITKSIYQHAWQALADVQLAANLKSTKLKSINLKSMDQNYIQTNLLLFKTWYLEAYLKLDLDNIANLNSILDTLENYFIKIFNQQPQVFVHVDYHSKNLILQKNKLGVIDFQDAMLGPITYDIVSLLQDAYLVWPEELVENILLDYFNYLKNNNIFNYNFNNNYNFAAFLRDFYLTGLQRHIKNLGVFARLKYVYKKNNYLQYIPNLLNYIHKTCNKFKEPELLLLLKLCKP